MYIFYNSTIYSIVFPFHYIMLNYVMRIKYFCKLTDKINIIRKIKVHKIRHNEKIIFNK